MQKYHGYNFFSLLAIDLKGAALKNTRGGPLIAYHEGESVRGPEDWVYREGENFALGALEVPTYWYGEYRRNP